MNLEEARYQEIEDYLKGRLSSEAQTAFEGKISADSGLAEDVAVQRVALKSLELAYMQTMSELVRERVDKNTVAKKYWIGGGGAILLTTLLVGGSYLLLNDKIESSISPQQIVTTSGSTVNTQPSKKTAALPQTENTVQNKKQLNGLANTPTEENRITPAPSEDSTLLNRNKVNESIHTRHVQTAEVTQKQVETITPINIKEQAVVAKTTCPEKAPEISVRVSPTSYDEASGSISINAPAHWKVYLKGANSEYETKNQFTDLAAGSYILFVQNEDKCNYQIGTYIITNSNCSFETNYVFNKQFDKAWSIPALTTSSYKVSILNKAGIEVFSENVAAHHNATWNGENKNGEKVTIGLHKVVISYSDNKTCIYNVVVSE